MRFSYRSGSKTGFFLGIAIAVGGVAAVWVGPTHTVNHGPVMRQSQFGSLKAQEQLTPARARLYGGVAVAGGVFLSLFSLYVPRPRPSARSNPCQ